MAALHLISASLEAELVFRTQVLHPVKFMSNVKRMPICSKKKLIKTESLIHLYCDWWPFLRQSP